jgi:hypothetical protein
MKRVIYNTGLVLVLMAVFALPLMGFGFVSYQEETPEVLGLSTVKSTNVNASAVSNSNKAPEVVEQFEYEVVLSRDSSQQTLYDVMPAAYLNSQNKFIVFIPQEFKDKGISVSLDQSDDSLDLNFASDSELTRSLTIPATILVLN